LPLVPGKVVERNGAEAQALNNDGRGDGRLGIRWERRLDGGRNAELARPLLCRGAKPFRLGVTELGELPGQRVESRPRAFPRRLLQ